MVNGIDPQVLEGAYRQVGSAAYPPDLMLKIALFEILEGRTSPAQWHRDAQVNLPLAWLGRGIRPSRTAWYNFRDRMGRVLPEVHRRLIQQAMREGLVDPQQGVLDGTAIRACASRHRLIHQETLTRRREELRAAMAQDARQESPATLPAWMAKTTSGRWEQSIRYDQAQEVLQVRLQENAKKPKDKRLEERRVLINPSEPEAPPGRDKEKVFSPLYTTEFLVEPSSLLIVSWEVFAQATDTGTLAPMLDLTQQIVAGALKSVTADASYATLLDLQACQQRGIELWAPVQENSFTAAKRAAKPRTQIPREQFTWLADEQTYVCPQGHRLDDRGKARRRRRGNQYVIEQRYQCSPQHCRDCPLAAQCLRPGSRSRVIKRLEGQELLDALREKMQTPEGQARRKQRGAVIERAFGDAKAHRNFRRLHGRGLRRAKAEVGLVVLSQNAMTLHRLRRSHSNPEEQPS